MRPNKFFTVVSYCLALFACCSTTTAEEFLYFVDVFAPSFEDGKIQRIQTDGTNSITVANLDSRLRGLAINPSSQELFWSNVELGATIQRAAADNPVPQTIVSAGLRFPIDLSIDESGGRLYWIDRITETIESIAFDGSDRRVDVNGVQGAAMDVDAVNGKIYFEHRLSADRGEIRRANLDGTGLETIVSDVPTATSLVVDASRETIFWTSWAGLANGGDAGIYKVDSGGSEFEEIFAVGSGLRGLAVDSMNGVLYFGQEVTTNRNNIYRIAIDGSNPEMVASGFGSVGGFELSSVAVDFIVPEPRVLPLFSVAGVVLLYLLNRRTQRTYSN
jgi:hypothetical protein